MNRIIDCCSRSDRDRSRFSCKLILPVSCCCLVGIFIYTLLYMELHHKLLHSFTTVVSLNKASHGPPAIKPYTPPEFCASYKIYSPYRTWPNNFADVPTNIKNKTQRDMEVLKLNVGNETLNDNDQATLDAYYDCHSLPGYESQQKLPCDDECLKFRQVLSRWPSNKPKAAIYILTLATPARIPLLTRLIQEIHTNFNEQFRYPVIVFFEKDPENSPALIRALKNYTVFFQTVSLELPAHKSKDKIPTIAMGASLGYRHMCTFHSKGAYEQPILTGLDYAWRLDDDSQILKPIQYDLFDFMRGRKISYGYVIQTVDSVVSYLWEASCRYVTEEHIRTEYFSEWPSARMFCNNFEISELSLWRSCAYQNYIDYIDRLGGIYYYRWGDAPIKSIALSLMMPKSKLHHFKDIVYEHQGWTNP